jgi:hypothetical protein
VKPNSETMVQKVSQQEILHLVWWMLLPVRSNPSAPTWTNQFECELPPAIGAGAGRAVWHFGRNPIPYALETDWPVGAAGFEPLHLEIGSAELHPASTGSRHRSGAP